MSFYQLGANVMDYFFDSETAIMDIQAMLKLALKDLQEAKQSLVELQNWVCKKDSPITPQKNISHGGDIGGESIGGIRGKREGGNKGGENTLQRPASKKSALRDFPENVKMSVSILNRTIVNNADVPERAYLQSREQMILAYRAYEKLVKLGYTDKQMEQAIFNAYRDAFWQTKLKHFKALANTSKNGALVIANLLKINSQNTKISTPIKAKYQG